MRECIHGKEQKSVYENTCPSIIAVHPLKPNSTNQTRGKAMVMMHAIFLRGVGDVEGVSWGVRATTSL
jgi:hypothetical protein